MIKLNKGDTFGKLTVIKEIKSYITPSGTKRRMFLLDCKCDEDTNKLVKVGLDALRRKRGPTISCGCAVSDANIRRSIHGKTAHPLYGKHEGMKQRCYNISNPGYKNYGGRGIGICDEWRGKNGFLNFWSWNESLPIDEQWKPGLEIDRYPDNDGNYEPSNCRWATNKQQLCNQGRNVYVVYEGTKYAFKELWEKLNKNDISYITALKRYKNGCPLIDSITLPKEDYYTEANRLVVHKGKTYKFATFWSKYKYNDVSYRLALERMCEYGWDPLRSVTEKVTHSINSTLNKRLIRFQRRAV